MFPTASLGQVPADRLILAIATSPRPNAARSVGSRSKASPSPSVPGPATAAVRRMTRPKRRSQSRRLGRGRRHGGDARRALRSGAQTQAGERNGDGPRAGRSSDPACPRPSTRHDVRVAARSRASAGRRDRAGRNGNPAVDDVSSVEDRDCAGRERLAFPHPRSEGKPSVRRHVTSRRVGWMWTDAHIVSSRGALSTPELTPDLVAGNSSS